MTANKFIYEATLHADLGKAIPAIGDLMAEVNSEASNFGYDGKLRLESPMTTMSISGDRALTKDELDTIHKMAQETINESSLAKYGIRLGAFRCKSVTSELSAE